MDIPSTYGEPFGSAGIQNYPPPKKKNPLVTLSELFREKKTNQRFL